MSRANDPTPKAILLIFTAALLIRLLMVAVWNGTGHTNPFTGDAHPHYLIAQSLVEGKGFQLDGEPTSRRAPLYPFFLALFLKFGWFPVGVEIAQAFLGALSCVLLFLIGRDWFSHPVGLLSAGIFSADYLFTKQTVSVLPEVIFIFFILLSFFFLIRAQKTGNIQECFFSGFFAGLSVLTKETLSLYFPLVIAAFLLKKKSRVTSATQILIFLASFLLVILPWVARNRLIYHQGIFLTINAGHVFYLGNNDQVKRHLHGGDWLYGVDSDYPKDDPQMPPLLTFEADRYLMKKGFEYVRDHPKRFVEMAAIKMLRLWFPYYSFGHPVAKWITALSYFLTMSFGILGVILSRNKWRELFPVYLMIAYVTLVHSITIPSIRYRYPLMPFLMIFAAFGLHEIWCQFERRKIKLRTPLCL